MQQKKPQSETLGNSRSCHSVFLKNANSCELFPIWHPGILRRDNEGLGIGKVYCRKLSMGGKATNHFGRQYSAKHAKGRIRNRDG